MFLYFKVLEQYPALWITCPSVQLFTVKVICKKMKII